MNLFFLHHAANDPKDPNKHPHVQPHGPIHDLSEGSEFLDDAIYQEDVPEVDPRKDNASERTQESPKN